jgi:alpha-D-xyloside xylohydrolase
MSLPFDIDGFVKNFNFPLQLVQSVESVQTSETGVALNLSTTAFTRRWRDRYGTSVEIGVPAEKGERVAAQVEFYTPSIFRFRMAVGAESVPANNTPMMTDEWVKGEHHPSIQIETNQKAITLASSELTVILHCSPWRIEVLNTAGAIIWETIPAAVYQHPPTGESHLDGASITDAWPSFVTSHP